METKKTIDLYKAIAQMREISREGGSFSMKFRKWDRQRNSGGDLVTVEQARLRPAAADDKISNASHKLFYVDTESGKAANCWQPLIVEFNGMATILN